MLIGPHDIAALAISIAQVLAYYWYLRIRVRRDPQYTVHAVNAIARARWVEAMMSVRGQEILAIQTLRNSVMSASFMASTAILLIVATLTLTGSMDHGAGVWHALNVTGATDERAAAIKLMLLLADFFVAFFCFAMAVRYFNHVGYMMTAPAQPFAGGMGPLHIAAYVNRAGSFYAFGTRAFFFCVPLVFWMFGPYFFAAATAALLVALYPFDRASKSITGSKPG